MSSEQCSVPQSHNIVIVTTKSYSAASSSGPSSQEARSGRHVAQRDVRRRHLLIWMYAIGIPKAIYTCHKSIAIFHHAGAERVSRSQLEFIPGEMVRRCRLAVDSVKSCPLTDPSIMSRTTSVRRDRDKKDSRCSTTELGRPRGQHMICSTCSNMLLLHDTERNESKPLSSSTPHPPSVVSPPFAVQRCLVDHSSITNRGEGPGHRLPWASEGGSSKAQGVSPRITEVVGEIRFASNLGIPRKKS